MSQPPPKPWERRVPGTITAPLNYRSPDFGTVPPTAAPVLTRVAPPVPPRPIQQTYRPAYSSFPSSYGSFGSSAYGGFSPYSYGGYGSYGLGYGGYGRLRTDDLQPSRFVQHAEESSRGAFQSVESIVHAFASVSMMLDATFSAVYNSFRAVLDVANHFSRLRAHFSKVLSAFALIRTLRYLYRRLQRALGVRTHADVEDLWADSVADGSLVPAAATSGASGEGESRVKSWPIFLFLAVVFGGPYLIWKLLRTEEGVEDGGTNWASGEDDHVVARAEYDFTGASEEEISVQAGDMLNLAPKDQQPRVRGWLLASLDGQTVGLVPANHVKILGKRRGRRQAELERLAQVQEGQRSTLSNTGGVAASETYRYPTAGAMATSETRPFPEDLLEAVYTETPTSNGNAVNAAKTTGTNAALGTSEKIDL